MLIPAATLRAIEAGTVTLAFRRWKYPRVLPGTALRTLVGLVEITSVDAVQVSKLTAADAHAAGFATLASLKAFLKGRTEGNIYRIGLRYGGPDPRIALRERADLGESELAELRGRLDRLGPWTSAVLRMIAERPGVRAPDLAADFGWETLKFKRRVRQLKELGLTESLEVGYRLSPRGRVVLNSVANAASGGAESRP